MPAQEHHTNSANAAFRWANADFDDINLAGIADTVEGDSEAVIDLAKLALRLGSEQILAINQHAAGQKLNETKLALHSLKNTFGFLQAPRATKAITQAECELAITDLEIPMYSLDSLNSAFALVEADLRHFIATYASNEQASSGD